MFKKAFSLAEILIVVAIIGTVAALTLPNLNDKYSEEQTILKLKKFQNELNSAHQQGILRYGNYSDWSVQGAEYTARLVDFLEVIPKSTFPVQLVGYTFYALKDGSYLAVTSDNSGHVRAIIATEGMKGVTYGKNIFGFYLDLDSDSMVPFGKNSDRGENGAFSVNSTDYINATNWAVTNENMDYLRCASSLNWDTKTTCD